MSMLRRPSTLWLVLGALAAAGGIAAAAWTMRREEPRWTTRSPEAAQEYERGLEAAMKFYEVEAYGHFERALELDPSFVMPRLQLIRYLRTQDKEAYQEHLEAIKAVDPARLNARERFILDYYRARQERQNAHADKLLTAYLDAHPDDPYALRVRCGQYFERRDWAAADDCNRRLLNVDPNWVEAQNQLGYSAMAQGRFDEAAELFRTYLYIAPDQANPHDSMGELLTIIGRYDEARASLEKAIEIRPDFCGSWSHLVTVFELRGDIPSAETTLARMREEDACEAKRIFQEECRFDSWKAYIAGDLRAAWRRPAERGCLEEPGSISLLAYRGAVLSGLGGEARPWAEGMLKEAKLYGEDAPSHLAFAAYIAGLDAYAGRDHASAVDDFRTADANLVYWGDGQALFKLFNRLDLSQALRASGQEAEAEAMVRAVADVNADLPTRFAAMALPLPRK